MDACSHNIQLLLRTKEIMTQLITNYNEKEGKMVQWMLAGFIKSNANKIQYVYKIIYIMFTSWQPAVFKLSKRQSNIFRMYFTKTTDLYLR